MLFILLLYQSVPGLVFLLNQSIPSYHTKLHRIKLLVEFFYQVTLVEKRSWSTSGFIRGHHQNFASTLICQLSVLRVPVVGGHQHTILKIEGTYALEKLWQNQQAKSISAWSQNPRIPALSVATFGHFHLQLHMHMIWSWPVCKVDESRNMIWSLQFNSV